MFLFTSLGYYCPTGSSVETQIICPAARHCPTGSASPQECPAGMFVDYDGAAACSVCPEGRAVFFFFSKFFFCNWAEVRLLNVPAIYIVQFRYW